MLEKDLSTVHPSLFSSLDDIGRSQVEQLLRSLGVKVWSPKELVNSHIIPTFKSDKWKVLNSHCTFGNDECLVESQRPRRSHASLLALVFSCM